MIVDNLISFVIVRYFIWLCYRHTFVVNTEYFHSRNASNPKKVGIFSRKMEYRWINCIELQRNIDLQGANFKILKRQIAGSIGNYLLLSLNYFLCTLDQWFGPARFHKRSCDPSLFSTINGLLFWISQRYKRNFAVFLYILGTSFKSSKTKNEKVIFARFWF